MKTNYMKKLFIVLGIVLECAALRAQEFRAPLVGLGEVDLDELIGEALFRQNDPHFLTEWARQEIVEFHHTRMAL